MQKIFIFLYLVNRKADRNDIDIEINRFCKTNKRYVIGSVPRILQISLMHNYFFHIHLQERFKYVLLISSCLVLDLSHYFIFSDFQRPDQIYLILTICVGALQLFSSSPSRISQSHFDARLCSPSATTSGWLLFMQWAAVRTQRRLMRDPPHENRVPPLVLLSLYPRSAMKGSSDSPAVAFTPFGTTMKGDSGLEKV